MELSRGGMPLSHSKSIIEDVRAEHAADKVTTLSGNFVDGTGKVRDKFTLSKKLL